MATGSLQQSMYPRLRKRKHAILCSHVGLASLALIAIGLGRFYEGWIGTRHFKLDVQPSGAISGTSAVMANGNNRTIVESDMLKNEINPLVDAGERENVHQTTSPVPLNTSSRTASSLPLNASFTSWPFRRFNDMVDSNNHLIVLIVSCPYLDFLDNLITSLSKIGLQNFVVVPLDSAAKEYATKMLSQKHVLSCPPFLPSFNSKRAAKFNTKPFQKLTSTRPKILESLIRLGHTVFYCDVDVYWNRNILELLGAYNDHDMVAMVDTPHPIEEGHVCSCYLYLQPTESTTKFLQHWQQLIDNGNYKNDQFAIYDAYKTFGKQLNSKLYPNNNPYFPSGAVYEDAMSPEQRSQVWLVHNNFIKGHDFKINRFLKWGLWKPSGKLESLDWEECNVR